MLFYEDDFFFIRIGLILISGLDLGYLNVKMVSTGSKINNGFKTIRNKHSYQKKKAPILLKKMHRKYPYKMTAVSKHHHSVDTESNILTEKFLKVIASENNKEALDLVSESEKHIKTIRKSSLNKALLFSCRKGNKFLVQSLLAYDIDINCKDAGGNTPLMISAKNGFYDIARLLLLKSPKMNCRNSHGDTALLLSITKSGSKDMVSLLLEQRSIDFFSKNDDGVTCFTKAIEMLDFELFRTLLTKSYYEYRESSILRKCLSIARRTAERLDISNIFDYMKQEILEHKFAVLKSDFKSVKFLFDYGWMTNKNRSKYDESFLMEALKLYKNNKSDLNQNDIDIVKLLISRAKESDHCAESNILHIGVDIGNSELLSLLCQYVNTKYSEETLNYIYTNGLEALFNKYNHAFVHILLGSRPNLMTLCEGRNNLIGKALEVGALEFVELFVSDEREFDVTENLLTAIKNCQLACFNFIAEKFQAETIVTISKDESVFLHKAVKVGNKEIVERLISLGADVNAVHKAKSPLMYCLDAEIAKILLSKGAKVTLKTDDSEPSALLNLYLTAHMYKYYYDEKKKSSDEIIEATLELTKLYLNHGANIDEKDSEGKTALMLASSLEGYTKVITYLLESGADSTMSDKEGHSAIYFAVANEIVTNVEELLKFQKDINAQCTSSGLTALHLAAERNNLDILRYLVSYQANLEAVDSNGNTALLIAIRNMSLDKKDAILCLLDAGCNINHQNNDHQTAIIIAAENSKTEMVTLLSERGADLNVRNSLNRKNVAEIMADKTAFSSSYDKREFIICTENLLKKGLSAANVTQNCIFRLILDNRFNLIQRLIFAGVSPCEISQIVLNTYVYFYSSTVGLTVSPFRYALMNDKLQLAQYFSSIGFLTSSECSHQQYIICREHLTKKNFSKCVEFVDDLYSQPMSLEKLALITVSSLIGPGLTREDKVKGLPLPTKFKDQLLFKTESTLILDTECDVIESTEVMEYFPFLINFNSVPDSEMSDYYGYESADFDYDVYDS
uniref:SOCS box domain-containing protein n=2 Tax=Biomphalaria glabrata TaxID=6526 RepID=A0A2C9L7Z8_BIOGL